MAAMLASGSSAGWSLVGGLAATAAIATCFAIASLILHRPVLPEIFVRFNDPPELLEPDRWGTREEPEREARQRNLRERVYYWREVEVSAGSWGIERVRFRGGSEHVADFGVGDYGWFGGDAGGGGGDGGGGG